MACGLPDQVALAGVGRQVQARAVPVVPTVGEQQVDLPVSIQVAGAEQRRGVFAFRVSQPRDVARAELRNQQDPIFKMILEA